MGEFIQQLGQQAASTALGGIMGLVLGGYNDQRQQRQQEDLMNMQIRGNKEMMDYSMLKQMEMWDKTNYAAQVAQLKKAGLNPALLYGKGGPGGITGSPGGGVSGAAAPAGGREIQDMIGMGLQMQMMKAQIENIEADTKTKEATVPKIETEIKSLTQGIENQKAVEELNKVESRIKKLEEHLKGETLDEAIRMADWNERIAIETMDRLARENIVDKATMNNRIDLVKAQLTAQLLMNEIHKITPAKYASEIKINLQQLTNMSHEIVQKWRALEIQGTKAGSEERRLWSEQLAKETGIETNVVGSILDGIILKSILKK